MIELALLFLILLSGSAYGIATKRISFAWGVALSTMGVTSILYLFGVVGLLKYGVISGVILALFLWGYSVFRLIKAGEIKSSLKEFFCPLFFVYIFLLLTVFYLNTGLLATDWDAFSCWVVRVKSMMILDDFTTNQNSFVSFKSYPPALACFQYLIQKLHMFGKSTNEFSEWRVFYAYQLFGISVMLPMVDRVKKWSNPRHIIGAVLFLFLFPLLFTPSYYTISYIDPIVGLMGGLGMTVILTKDSDQPGYHMYLSLLCFLLVLMKDVGLLLAGWIALTNMIVTLVNTEKGKHRFLNVILPFGAMALAKISWVLKLKVCDVETTFSAGNIDLFTYTKYFILGNAPCYYQEVIDNIKNAYFTQEIAEFPLLDKKDTCILEFIICGIMILAALLIRRFAAGEHSKTEYGDIRKQRVVYGASVLLVMFYGFALGATYCSNFGEYEAVGLASFSRYMGIVFFVFSIVSVCGLAYTMDHVFGETDRGYYLLIVIFMFRVDYGAVKDYVTKASVFESWESRKDTIPICNLIEEYCDTEDRVYMVTQESSEYPLWVSRFEIYPMHLYGGSIGIPFYDGDVWTRTISSEEWWAELNNNYDYVALYGLNDYFTEEFGNLFDDRTKIRENTIFRVDREHGVLQYVDGDIEGMNADL